MDGYVNATAMCKANWRNGMIIVKKPAQYLQALKRSTGFPADPITTIKDGLNQSLGTYVHLRLAVALPVGSVLSLLCG